MFKRLLQDVLSLTPFIPPNMTRFYKLADADGFLYRIPLFKPVLNILPPLKWIDSKLEYPFLTIGRIVVSLVVVYCGVNFTSTNQEYRTFVNKEVIYKITPSPVLLQTNTGSGSNPLQNSFNNIQETFQNQIKFASDNASATIKQSLLSELLYGSIGVLVRGPLIWVGYSLLFFLLGNTLSQRDSKTLSRISGLRTIGTEFINNLNKFVDGNRLAEIEKKFSTVTPEKRLYNNDYQKTILALLKK